jgi:hypothetical protein
VTNRFWPAFVVFSIVMLLTMWLSSGSMTPFATVSKSSKVIECGYLVNTDHDHWEAIYDWMDGREYFKGSIVMRRVLYPLFAYPFMKVWGFMGGGFIATALLYLITMISFAYFLSKKMGNKAAFVWMMLFSTYPGIHYYAGLPYAYACIASITVFSTMILWQVLHEESAKRILLYALLQGILCTAYDIMPFFGFAFILILLKRRKYLLILPSIILFLVPQLAVLGVLYYHGIPIVNYNSALYMDVLLSYFRKPNYKEWFLLIEQLPSILTETFLYSAFLFLPLMFLGHIVLAVKYQKRVFTEVEKYILLAVVVVFLINNLAPPYVAWQMRGHTIYRLYQPVFIVYLLVAVRLASGINKLDVKLNRLFWASCISVFLLNTIVVVGSASGFAFQSAYLYNKFYQYEERGVLLHSLKKYGRVPIGICRDQNAVVEYANTVK